MLRSTMVFMIAIVSSLPALAATRRQALAPRCGSPTGYVSPGQAQAGGSQYAGCQVLEQQEPTCTPDSTICACFNEGTAKDFVLCGWDLVHHCETTPGCVWWTNNSGDVYCACQTPIP